MKVDPRRPAARATMISAMIPARPPGVAVALASALAFSVARAAERSVPAPVASPASSASPASPPETAPVPMAPHPAPATQGKGVLRVLAIGVDEASDAFFPRLKWAESDARSFASAVGKGTDRAPVPVVLVGAAATREGVRAALAKLARESRPEDDVVIYFSGHGTLAVSGEGRLERVLVLKDTARDAPLRTGVSVGFLRDLLEAVPARRKAAVIAACHSGTGKSKVSDEVLALLRGAKGTASTEDKSEGVLVLAAAAREETAREDDSLGGDIYSHFLREALARGDLDGDGAIDALEAHDYARRRTLEYTKGRQRPSLEASVVGEGEVVLAGKAVRRGAPMLHAYGDAMSGLGIKANGTDKGPGAQGLTLRPGRNEIEIYAEADEGRPVARYVVDALEGDSLTLEDLSRPMPLRLGVSLGLGFAASGRTERTYGSARFLGGGLVEWRTRSVSVSVGAEASSSSEVPLAPGVEARLSSAVFPLRVAGWMSLFHAVEGGAWAEALHERQSLSLSDSASGDGTTRSASGIGWGAGVALRFPLAWRFEQEITLGYRSFEARFGDWGLARSHRSVVAWTFSCAFGRYVRRVR